MQIFCKILQRGVDYSAVDVDGKIAFGITFEIGNPELFRVLFEDFKSRSVGDGVAINHDLLSIINEGSYD